MNLHILQETCSRVVPLNGTPTELKVFEVCDPTGQTSLSVWDRLVTEVSEGRSYRFTALSTRREGQRIVLTCTPTTTVAAVPAVGQPASVDTPVRAESTIEGQVSGVQLAVKPRCKRCHAAQDKFTSKSTNHRCERCKMLQRSNTYLFIYSGVIVLLQSNGHEEALTLTNSAVFNYVRDSMLAAVAHDGGALEEHVMDNGQVVATVNEEGLVVRFASSGRPAEVEEDEELVQLLEEVEDEA